MVLLRTFFKINIYLHNLILIVLLLPEKRDPDTPFAEKYNRAVIYDLT